MNKEEIYDSEINPLMAQIIEICKANKICFLASFDIRHEGNEDLRCTSAILREEFNPPKEMLRALDLLYRKPRSISMMTVEKADGTKEIHAFA